ncbi:MAG: hypothetical protein VXW22_06990 [Pseudomonadota bacterium]|jgi:hypothetical protein|nr:hypothetical protein [Pseudomonadota bacterium]
MLVDRLRLLALACIVLSPASVAQDADPAPPLALTEQGEIYELNRQDVTLPIATAERSTATNGDAVTVPLENLATPMRCMAAWSYLATSTIRTPALARAKHPDFTEATASAHWQHWLKLDLDAHQGQRSADFHQRRLAAERAFSTAMSVEGEGYAYRTLGSCYVDPAEREIADPTILLRNFMVEFQGLPDTYTIPVLQRQLRAFPISETIEVNPSQNCDQDATIYVEHARVKAINTCFDRGGILASAPKSQVEDLDGACRATSTIQCENIP